MSSANVFDSWLQMFSSSMLPPTSVHFPGSGNIGGFTYQPNTVWEAPSLYRGNSTLEQAVYTDIASPGKQLGKLMDVVLEMAQVLETELKGSEKVNDLKVLAEKIEKLKAPSLDNSLQVAREDLDKLLRTNERSLRLVIEEYSGKLSKEGSGE
jgi:hypothetical protein